jgi:hypothetical protein
VVELRRAARVIERVFSNQELYVPKKAKKRIVRREYSKADVKENFALTQRQGRRLIKLRSLPRELKGHCGKRR